MDITRLKQAKKEKRLTYEQLSKISGVPISTIYDMFRGVTTAPRIDTVQAIEKALGVPPSLEWTNEEMAEGVGRHPTYLSDDEVEWLELRSELLRCKGQEYLNALILLINGIIKNKL